MSREEKDIIRRIAVIMPELDANKQNYILGVAEGMVIAKETMEIERLEQGCGVSLV